MPQTPGIGFPVASQTDLWRDISRNLFEIAQAHGYAEILEPNGLDGIVNSMRKSVTFTYAIANNP